MKARGAASLLMKLAALVLGTLAVALALNYPVAPYGLAAGLLGIAALQLRWPLIWLFILPWAIPLLDLAPWSGRIYLEDYDLLVLAAASVALWQGRYSPRPLLRRRPGLAAILALLAVSYLISLSLALWPPPPPDVNAFSSYLSPYNGLRHAKAFAFALLLLPALAHALREDPERTARHFAWGAAAGVASLGLVAMWERGVFAALAAGADRYGLIGSLLDFTGTYRITGLFHDMQAGGEAVDAYLALTWPAALWLLFTSRGRLAAVSAAVALALGLYGVTVTFSRVSYFALAVGALAMVLAYAWTRRRTGAVSPRVFKPRWAALAAPSALAVLLMVFVVAFQEGGLVVLLACVLGMAAAILLGFLRARLGWPLALGLTVPLAAVAAGAAIWGLATSKWVAHGTTQSLLLGTGLAGIAVLGGGIVGVSLAGRLRIRQLLAVLTLAALGIGAVYPALFGYRMSERSATLREDLESRQDHWGRVGALSGDGIGGALFGKGLGRFPSDFLWRFATGEVGMYALGRQADNTYLALDMGREMVIGQRLNLEPGQEYRLRLKLRFHDASARMAIGLCRRHILKFERWDPSCVQAPMTGSSAQGLWEIREYRLHWPDTAAGVPEWLRHPPVLELSNRTPVRAGIHGRIDLDDLQLLDAQGRNRLVNGDFQNGMDRWLAYYDFQHLPWHIKNLWVHLSFEQGWLGVAAMSLLWLYALGRALMALREGSSVGVHYLGILTAALTVGMVGAILDVPRVAFLLFLSLGMASMISRGRSGRRMDQGAGGIPLEGGGPAARYGGYRPGRRNGGGGAGWLPWLSWGGASLVLGLGGLYLISRQFDARPGLVIAKSMQGLGVDSAWIRDKVTGVPDYRDHVLDGRVRASHPRILLSGLAGWPGLAVHPEISRRQAGMPGHQPEDCAAGDVLKLASCWLQTADPLRFRQLDQAMQGFRLTQVTLNTDSVGNGWQLALAYDLARSTPLLDQRGRRRIEAILLQALNAYLDLLDRPEPSLWHGRAPLAAAAWLCAIALDAERLPDQSLVSRAQGHFLEAMRALALTEAWPEGYNYWINSRAFVLTLAASAYLNGLEGAARAEEIRRVMRRAGHWHLYATRPDNRIEALGDEGPRVDLKDETQRVIDLIAGLTRDPVFTRFSRHIEALHGVEGYYYDYRWGKPLFQDPEPPGLPVLEPGSLRGLELSLPTAALFGPRALDQAYIRSGWGKDDSFISYRAGKSFTHHGHYDAGHFTLFKGAPLAVKSGVYSGVLSPHRLYYSVRTVAQNSLLVLRPGEQVRPNRLFTRNVAEGGQRLVMPTGSAVHSVREWRENLGAGGHFEGGEVTGFDHRPGGYTYIDSDLTQAYDNPRHDSGGSGGKVTAARRELLYLPGEDRLIVHDDVSSSRPEYVKKWLLHTITRPQADGLLVRRGGMEDGILETRSGEVRVHNGRGHLLVQRLLPAEGLTRLVGGERHRFYVEADGDDGVLDGFNAEEGVGTLQPWFDTGLWRLEFQPARPAARDHFLVVLSPSLERPRTDPAALLRITRGEGQGVALSRALVVFVDRAATRALAFSRPGPQQTLYLLGLPPLALVRVTADGQTAAVQANASGVLAAGLPGLPGGAVRVDW